MVISLPYKLTLEYFKKKRIPIKDRIKRLNKFYLSKMNKKEYLKYLKDEERFFHQEKDLPEIINRNSSLPLELREKRRSKTYIYQTYRKYLEPITKEDILTVHKNKNELAVERAIYFTDTIVDYGWYYGKDSKRIYKKDYKFMIFRLTIGGRKDKAIGIRELKKIDSKISELLRWDKKAEDMIIGFHCQIEGEREDNVHLHYCIGLELTGMDVEESEEYVKECMDYLKDYWYRVTGRVMGYYGRDLDKCVEIGKEWVWINVEKPIYPKQKWYIDTVEDRNNVLEYVIYQCKDGKYLKDYRKENKGVRLGRVYFK